MSARAVLRLVAAGLWLLACFPAYLVARPFGREQLWVRRFLRGVGRLVGLRVTVAGAPPREGLLVANHISWLDILALGGATTTRFVAKAEIAGWPLVGPLARLGGVVFISRDRRSATRTQADAVAEALRGSRPVTLFAEGGTGDGLVVEPFRPALFAAAVEAGATVHPVAIDYGPGRAAYAWPEGVSFAAEARRLLERRTPVPVTLRFLPPLDPAALDRKALAVLSRAAVAGALEQVPA